MVGPNISLWLTVPEGGITSIQSISFRTPSDHERTNSELATLCKVSQDKNLCYIKIYILLC